MNNLVLDLTHRSILSKKFIIAIIIGILTAVYNLLENIDANPYLIKSGALNIFLHSTLFERNIFMITAPLIACIASGIILYEELESGFSKQLIIRHGFKKYFWSRILSVITVAILTVVFLFVLVLAMSLIVSPLASYKIELISSLSPFASIYYKSMILYILLFFLNSCVLFASYALLGCGIFMVTNNYYIGYIIPPAFYSLSSYSYGKLFGSLKVLPYSTYSIHLISFDGLIQDHLAVLIIGILLCLWGYKKWCKMITY